MSTIAIDIIRPGLLELLIDIAAPNHVGILEDSRPRNWARTGGTAENRVSNGPPDPLGDGNALTVRFVHDELGQVVRNRNRCAFHNIIIAYYSDVSEGSLQAGGSAGVADLDFLKDLVDRAERGFLAWLAVDPEYQHLQLGKRLLQRVYLEMERKGYQETLLSWEMRDGALTEDDFSPVDDNVTDRIAYEIYRR